MEELIVRYFHFIGIIFLSGTLAFEHLLLKEEVTNENFKRICRVDIFYGLSAMVTLFAGIILLFFIGKDSSFYFQNPFFHVKLTLFVLMGLLSIIPTLFFIKNRHTKDEIVKIPKKLIMITRVELLLLVLIPLFAVFVANGYGYNG